MLARGSSLNPPDPGDIIPRLLLPHSGRVPAPSLASGVSTASVMQYEEEVLVGENPTVPLLRIVWSVLRFSSLNEYDMID